MVLFNRMTLPGRDWRAARDWYVTHLGFSPEWENPQLDLAAISDASGFKIFLCEGESAANAQLAFALEVDDVERRYQAMTRAGVTFEHGPQKTFWGYGAEARDPNDYVLRLWDARSMREKG